MIRIGARPTRGPLLSRFFTVQSRRLHLSLLAITAAGAVLFASTKTVWSTLCGGLFYSLGLAIIAYQLALIAGLCVIGWLYAAAGSRGRRLQIHRAWVYAGAVLHGMAGPILLLGLAFCLWPHRHDLAGDVAMTWLVGLALLELFHAYAPRGPVRAALRITASKEQEAPRQRHSA